eukprot:CAMPEP_0114358630 /NCGR_PEP_ID=MMETSP0101-20121206/22435_1 /TAXON_ID=38822 ORGANISM="Pteridomonas danica, Strain PT" /NCGR_SAMPLE_ID=MMETSP0101 /ASSEMBLY_ACC=CAM_ASM_000211 /LENGTH=175 /DNA_ID=CAMNT_0001501817 /DNA_START=7 /DNA_END=530 /DNA_ORIENTATION=+
MASSFFSTPTSTYFETLYAAERSLLDSIPWGDSTYTLVDVPISFGGDSNNHIHTIVATHPNEETESEIKEPTYPIVLWHGFAQSAGSWWRCIPGLAKAHAKQGKVYALDWIGVGGSSRPKWTAGDDPKLAEEWFVESLEHWRIHQGYEKIHLVAHSLSALIATRYAEKYPNRLET